MKNYTEADKIIIKSNNFIGILFNVKSSGREYPAKNMKETIHSNSEKKLVTNLMRVNHSGEVAAQGLYIGHALVAKTEEQKKMMLNMAAEEKDHLKWCEKRINELNGRTSILNPLWFAGSVVIGMLSSVSNDKNGLGFIEETEKQVANHLDSHINKIPDNDKKTYKILKKMKTDEENHAKEAHKSGANKMPLTIKKLMKITANIMKFTSYRL
jgi:ubiquinone biosynthesis monooxygenase Coq7